jgi:hypothetical protein
MKRKKIFIALWTFLLSVDCLYGQQQTKVIDFGNNAEITLVKACENYIAIKVNYDSAPGVACLFDKSGNKLLEKKEDEGVPITQVEPSDMLNYFITVDKGWDDAEGYSGPTGGNIRAYNIATGDEVWRVYANAEGYRISPDGLHMMNGDEGGPGPILNLKDGSTVRLDQKLVGTSCDWLDNDRIVIAFQHSIDLNLKKITKEEYDTKTAELTQEIDELEKQESDENKKISLEDKHATILSATKLSIYNIRTGQIESEKDIYAPDGEPIVLNAGPLTVGIINVERATQSIYLYANKGTLGTANQNTRCLVKLDKLLSVVSVVAVGGLTKLLVNDKIYFISGGKYLIKNDTLELFQSNKIKTEYGEINLDTKSNRSVQTFIPGMEVGENSNSLEFSIRRETQN